MGRSYSAMRAVLYYSTSHDTTAASCPRFVVDGLSLSALPTLGFGSALLPCSVATCGTALVAPNPLTLLLQTNSAEGRQTVFRLQQSSVKPLQHGTTSCNMRPHATTGHADYTLKGFRLYFFGAQHWLENISFALIQVSHSARYRTAHPARYPSRHGTVFPGIISPGTSTHKARSPAWRSSGWARHRRPKPSAARLLAEPSAVGGIARRQLNRALSYSAAAPWRAMRRCRRRWSTWTSRPRMWRPPHSSARTCCCLWCCGRSRS